MGFPWGQGGSENSQNFAELVGGGHPGVQLLCKVPDYSTRVKTWNQILVFDCFKFNDAPLELVGGDHGEGQILFTSSKFDQILLQSIEYYEQYEFILPTQSFPSALRAWLGSSPESLRRPSSEGMVLVVMMWSSALMSMTLHLKPFILLD